MFSRTLVAALAFSLLFACGGRDNGIVDSGHPSDGGGNPADSGTPDSGSIYLACTVNQCVSNLSQFSGGGVAVTNAVVVAAATIYTSASPNCTASPATVETFYIQDSNGGPGLGVYKGCKDTAATPAVGDVVTVMGRLSKFDASLQISGSASHMIPESIVITSAGTGHSTGGAQPPAGSPIVVSTAADYAPTAAAGNAHPEQIGNVLSFPGATVTNMRPTGFVTTGSDGGNIIPRGFEITGGVLVDDSIIYHDCIKPLNLDGGTLSLPNGVRGVWDRYQDYYGGTASNPAPINPVVVPLTCADIQ